MPMLDAPVRRRYPAGADTRQGPVKLKPVALESGWVADNTSWKSGLTAITPAAKFRGEVARSSWLLNEDLAFIYRAYSTLDWPLRITSPSRDAAREDVYDRGSAVTIQVDASKFPGWTKLECYDGAKKLGTVTQGPAQFTATNLIPGYHVFSVLGTDAAGAVRTSNPALAVVR